MTVPAETLTPVPWDADIASAAALIADSTRAAILRALLPDRPLAAGELARLAGVSAATASFHLAKLLEGGMITVIRAGQAPLLPAGRARGRGGARRARSDQPRPAGAQPAPVTRGGRAGRGQDLLRPPGWEGR